MLSGMWYEQAYIDVAQAGASCQTLNVTEVAADGRVSTDFNARYLHKGLPFRLIEEYTPSASGERGLYTKRALVPGGKHLQLPTVVVDVQSNDSLVLFSCLSLGAFPAVTELVVATRARTAADAHVDALVDHAQSLAVPFDKAHVKRVEQAGCP